jgi:hypothetical protein
LSVAVEKRSETEFADLHWIYLGGIERGERNPTLINIEKLAKALEISLYDMFVFNAKS